MSQKNLTIVSLSLYLLLSSKAQMNASVPLQPDDQPGNLVFRSLETVWAWYRSATTILHDNRLNIPIDLNRLEFTTYDGYTYDIGALSHCLGKIFDIDLDDSHVIDLVRRTWKAKVHAEAALMGNACSELEVGFSLKFSSSTDRLM